MPLYEYECQACRSRMEFIQKFSDPPKKKCPECGGKLKRLISAPGIQFKGTGWYVTDYPRGGSSGATEPSGSNGSSSGSEESKSGGSKGAEAKPTNSSSSASGSSGSSRPPTGRPARRPARASAQRRRRGRR